MSHETIQYIIQGLFGLAFLYLGTRIESVKKATDGTNTKLQTLVQEQSTKIVQDLTDSLADARSKSGGSL